MLDIPRLFTAAAEWGACAVYISFIKKRLSLVKLIPLLVLWLVLITGWQIAADLFPLSVWALGMIGAAALMIACMWSCCKLNFIGAAYWGVAAFIVAEFIASVEWQLYYYIYVAYGGAAWIKYLFFAVVYIIGFVILWAAEKRFYSRFSNYNVTFKKMLALGSIVLVCFVLSNIAFIGDRDEWSVQLVERVFEIRTLVDLCGIVLLYTYRLLCGSIQEKTELHAMQNIIENQYLQYRQYKENDEAINRHYHDLKHRIDVILSENDDGKRSEYLREMRHSIKIKQAENKTGNEVLDVLLTSKSFICVESDITFTVVADGKLLKFMSTMDLCSIIGNAVDNAIESVKKIEDPDKRLIQFALFSQNGWVVLRIKNYFEQPLNYNGDELITAKKDKQNHGFGLKSIRYIAEKYGGSMKIIPRDNWFTLCLLFPIDKLSDSI